RAPVAEQRTEAAVSMDLGHSELALVGLGAHAAREWIVVTAVARLTVEQRPQPLVGLQIAREEIGAKAVDVGCARGPRRRHPGRNDPPRTKRRNREQDALTVRSGGGQPQSLAV